MSVWFDSKPAIDSYPSLNRKLMNYLLFLILILTGSASTAAAQSAPADLQIFLLMGQANMAGRTPPEAEDKRPDPNIWMLDAKGKWVPAAEPMHFDKPARVGVGPGLAFGRAVLAANPGMKIGLVPCAVGGTPLSQWEKGGELFVATVARARQAAASGRLRGGIWHQGENDSREGDPAPTYEKRLIRMIADLRAELGAPNLPFVVGELGHFLDPEIFPQAKMVNAALHNVVSKVRMTALASAEGLKDKGDRSHFAADAQRELGKRYAKGMQSLLGSANAAGSSGPGGAKGGKSGSSAKTIPGIGLELLPVALGKFTMGSPANEPLRTKPEGPQTEVTITRPYWLGKYEVTHGEWKAITGADLAEQVRRALADDTLYALAGKNQTLRDRLGLKVDSDPKVLLHGIGDRIPMHWISWDEVAEFCQKLTERERKAGRLPGGYVYRLPTEAEWEYACRAGTTTATYAGKFEVKGKNNAPVLDQIAWYAGNSNVGHSGPGMDVSDLEEKQYSGKLAGPRDVGGKAPNAWGFHDMLGNVWEWNYDWYKDQLPGKPATDPIGAPSGTLRSFHGGGWHSALTMARAGYRNGRMPNFRSYNMGFRVALAPAILK